MRRPGLAALTAAAVLAAAKAAAAFSVVPPSLRGVAVGPVLLPPLPAAAEKGAADGESAAASSAAAPHVPSPRTGRYQSGAYDRPIVLLGCSGPGNELTRLASSLAQALAPDDAAAPSGAGGTMGPGGGDEDGASWSVLQAVGRAGSAATVLGAEALAAGIEGAEMGGGEAGLSRSAVVVIDLGHPAFDGGGTEAGEQLERAACDLARSLYADLGLLCVYVNVHPDHGRLSTGARERRERLEADVLVGCSDYEVCVKDEGLDAMAVLAGQRGAAAGGEDGAGGGGDGDAPPVSLSSPSDLASLRSLSSQQARAWAGVEWELQRLTARASLPPPVPGASSTVGTSVVGQNAELTMGRNTFFLSIVFPDMNEVRPYVGDMCLDVDAMEFRADLLGERNDRFEILHSVQLLRRICLPHVVRAPALPLSGLDVIDDAMPIVFTVRTAGQAGTWPDRTPADIAAMFDTLELGLRGGVDVLDVESSWDPDRTDRLLTLAEERYTSNILGSYHEVPNGVSDERAVELYHQCALGGRAHGAKLVLSVDPDRIGAGDAGDDDRQTYEMGKVFERECQELGRPVIPYLGMMLGEAGQFSRVLNERFAPVTHETLPFVAAPGQLAASEIMTLKLALGLLRPRKHCIVGHDIAYSVSPAMHSAAFAATRLPHSYFMVDIPNIDEFIMSDLWKDDDFGGCSVTIPHKRSIVRHLDEVSDSVKKIGAVNTVVVKEVEDENTGEMRKIRYGANTDWRGFYAALRRRLEGGAAPCPPVREAVLIVGAGGAARAAAYAIEALGGCYEQLYYNPRTLEKAAELAETFGGTVVWDLEDGLRSALEDLELRVVISALPASADFVLPQWLIEEGDDDPAASIPRSRPTVFDVNYQPYWTKLLSQAEEAGLKTVRGSEVVWEQGVGQFELWTGRMAPYRVMKQVVLKNTLPRYTAQAKK